MKLVIQTQYKENYAAHNEDYVHGVSEPYWKFKGGDCYIIHGLSIEQVQAPGFWDHLYSLIEYSHESAEEYILSDELIDDVDFDESKHVNEWECPINCTVLENGNIKCVKQSKDFVDLSKIVAERSWEQSPGATNLNFTYNEFGEVA